MLFNSFEFLLFFPVVVFVYFVIPKKWQTIWLLASSYFFYMQWDAKYIVLLLFTTGITYFSGLKIEQADETKTKKKYLVLSVLSNLFILFCFKYVDFSIDCIRAVLTPFSVTIPKTTFNLVLPVGISFYIFQALSYAIDVYRGEIKAEKSIIRYALFVSFFPQLVAGPIERSKNLLSQIGKPHSFDYERMREGLLLMLWGFFMKLVIGDRAGIIVDTVYGDIEQYPGMYLVIASILFAIQIYCDFAGYSTIAIGAAKVLGFDLIENFNCPYLSCSIGDFWGRWHIALSQWFRDYVYIPLGGNRKGNLCKYRNVLIVMLVSGMWHGAAMTYIVWGLLHGLYQVMESILKPVFDRANKMLRLKPQAICHKMIQIIITFGLVDFAWIFFRAQSISQAVSIIESIFTVRNWNILRNNSLYELGVNEQQFKVLLVAIMLLVLADFFKTIGIKVRMVIMQQELWCRWIIYITCVLSILIFGVWGSNYDATSFIYFQF